MSRRYGRASRGVSRRGLLKTAAVGAAGVSLAPVGAEGKQTPTGRPNMIYVFADQLRYLSCGYAGDGKARTPNLDRLASQGVNFRNAVSTMPVCAAHRASLLTGKYPTTTGMVINELRLSPDHECFGHVLTRGGYETGYIGKWHLWANQLGSHGLVRNGFVPPGAYRLGFDGYWAAYNFNHDYKRAYYFRDTPERIRVNGYEPDVQTGLAIDFVNKAAGAGRPFALFLSYGTPHDPWGWNNVPEKFARMFRNVPMPNPPNYKPTNDPYADNWGSFRNAQARRGLPQWRQAYYAMVANLDWNVGRLMAAIDKAGLADNTILVFSSDHGEMFGAHGRRAKNTFYEEAARVPLLVRWPKGVRAGRVSDACIGTPDIMPTILSMMHLPIPEAVEGVDLSHCATGGEGAEPEAAFMQNTGACAAWKDGHEWRALRSKRYTYAVYRVDRKELLFDNQADPFQTRNLAGSPGSAGVVARFRRLLTERMAALKDTFPASSWYRKQWIVDRNIIRGAAGGTHDLKALKKILAKYSAAYGKDNTQPKRKRKPAKAEKRPPTAR